MKKNIEQNVDYVYNLGMKTGEKVHTVGSFIGKNIFYILATIVLGIFFFVIGLFSFKKK